MIENVVSIVGVLGLGAIVGAFFQAHLQHKNSLKAERFELKQKRYLCSLIIMMCKLDPSQLDKTRAFRADLKTEEDIDLELKSEFLNALIFANDDVLQSFKEFLEKPCSPHFLKTVNAMRKDLWGDTAKRFLSESDVVFK